MTVAVFNFVVWSQRFPEFNGVVGPGLAQQLFAEAGLYCDNSDCSPVADLTQRLMLLNMVTAHIAALGFGTNVQPASPLVGRITNANEGSVSVAVDMGAVVGSERWFMQTKYGAQFWQASSPYRRGAIYVPGYAAQAYPVIGFDSIA